MPTLPSYHPISLSLPSYQPITHLVEPMVVGRAVVVHHFFDLDTVHQRRLLPPTPVISNHINCHNLPKLLRELVACMKKNTPGDRSYLISIGMWSAGAVQYAPKVADGWRRRESLFRGGYFIACPI